MDDDIDEYDDMGPERWDMMYDNFQDQDDDE